MYRSLKHKVRHELMFQAHKTYYFKSYTHQFKKGSHNNKIIYCILKYQ